MKKLYISNLILIILLALGVLAETTIMSDDFSSSGIDGSIWNGVWSYGTMTANSTGGFLNISGNSTGSGKFIEVTGKQGIAKNESGAVYASITLTSNPDGNTHFGFALSDHVSGGTFVSAPPTYCGVYVYAQNNNFKIAHNYPTAAVLKTIQATDTSTHTIKIKASRYFNPNSTIFEVYFDNVLQYTENQSSLCAATLIYPTFFGGSTNNAYKEAHFDDYSMTGFISRNLTGAPCNQNQDCESGSCQYGYCALKAGRDPCVNDGECLSGVCQNNFCTKVDMWTALDYSKDQIFGEGSATSNFISLVIVLGVAIMCGGSGAPWVGLGFLIMGTIFFTLVGWLSPFFLVGIVILGLMIMVLGAVIGSKG